MLAAMAAQAIAILNVFVKDGLLMSGRWLLDRGAASALMHGRGFVVARLLAVSVALWCISEGEAELGERSARDTEKNEGGRDACRPGRSSFWFMHEFPKCSVSEQIDYLPNTTIEWREVASVNRRVNVSSLVAAY